MGVAVIQMTSNETRPYLNAPAQQQMDLGPNETVEVVSKLLRIKLILFRLCIVLNALEMFRYKNSVFVSNSRYCRVRYCTMENICMI